MRNTFTTAHGSLPVREGALVEIQTHDGLAGFGDIAPLAEFGCGTLAGALGALPELVACIRAMSIDEALAFLWQHVNAYPSSLVSGLELALLDVQGKVLHCPLSHLLLEYSGLAGTYAARESVRVNAVVGSAELDVAVEAARAAVAKGFGCIKLKVGMGQGKGFARGQGKGFARGQGKGFARGQGKGFARGQGKGFARGQGSAQGTTPTVIATQNEQATIERVAAVRRAIGPNVHLRLDANAGWSFGQAKTILRACEAFDIQYVEQPSSKHDIDGMARLRRAVAIPIAADEAVSDLASARLLIRRGAADILIVKPQFARGLRVAQQIVIEAEEQGIPCVLTSAMESGIGVAGVLHLVAALPQVTLECGLATLPLLEDDLLMDSLPIDKGLMHVPAGVGLGVQVDMRALERYHN